MVVATAISLALAGCAAPAGVSRAIPGLDLLPPTGSPPSQGIRIQFAVPARIIQSMPADWASASFTLTSSTALATTSLTQTVTKAGNFNDTGPRTAASSGVTLFGNTRPGSYTLYAKTSAASVINAVGYVTPVTLSAGSATNVTITMRTLPEWTAGTLAGTGAATAGDYGDAGDGGAPGSAKLSSPKGIAFDSGGNLYVADSGNHRVRKINQAQTTISLIAGDGNTATLNSPAALAYDSGNDCLFIAAAGSAKIHHVSAIQTGGALAGTSIDLAGLTPVGLAHVLAQDALYVSLSNHTVVKITTPSALTPGAPSVIQGSAGVSGNTASGSLLATPAGLAFDGSTSLYLAESGNHQIRKITLPGCTSTIIAGTGSAGYSGDGQLAASASLNTPTDLVYDSSDGGRLYVLDSGNNVVRAITLANGMIATVAGTGTAGYSGNAGPMQRAALDTPIALGFDSASSSLYVSEGTGHRIRRGL